MAVLRDKDGEASEVFAEDGVKTAAFGVNARDEAVSPDEGVDGRDGVGVTEALRLFCCIPSVSIVHP